MKIRRRSLVLASAAPWPDRPDAARPDGRSARIGWLAWSGNTAPDRSVPLIALRAGLARPGWRASANLTRGARPAELPVELPTRFSLALNEKTARAIRLPLPAALRARADEVIA